MKHVKKSLLVGAALLGAMSLGGCATKEYVNKQVLGVHTEAQATQTELDATKTDVATAQSRNSAQDQQLAQLDTTTREALQRATAAGKLAEGKFLYSMVLSDDSVKFPTNRYALSPEAEARLAELIGKLKGDNKNVYLEIQGHTDASGNPNYNDRLGEERAEAVRRYLAKNGVALNRMSTISYGEEQPVADNKTREGRAQNRRVVVVVLS
ncbi:MAG: OmpA/MotB domain protein [Caulobacteraceae bacterium]|nr:OmpA/MotB domain protein [Caulobacteraceae bacterium]